MRPPLQVIPQVLPVQVAVEFAGCGHTMPQPLQLLVSDDVLVEQSPVLQFAKPGLQKKPQVPPVQVAVPLVTSGHVLPQPLQLFGSKDSLTQLPLQLLKPLAQAKPHTPLVQVARALAGGLQQVTLLPFLHKSVVLGQPMQTVMQ